MSSLTQQFITKNNSIKWGALGAAIAGSGVYAVFIGMIRFGLSIGEAIQLVVNRTTGVAGAQLNRFLGSFESLIAQAWGGPWLDGGPLQLLVSILPVLLVLGIVAWGVRRTW